MSRRPGLTSQTTCAMVPVPCVTTSRRILNKTTLSRPAMEGNLGPEE